MSQVLAMTEVIPTVYSIYFAALALELSNLNKKQKACTITKVLLIYILAHIFFSILFILCYLLFQRILMSNN